MYARKMPLTNTRIRTIINEFINDIRTTLGRFSASYELQERCLVVIIIRKSLEYRPCTVQQVIEYT